MAGSRRSQPLPSGWARIREGILRRDNYECQIPKGSGLCRARANQVDHIVPAYLGGNDAESNLRAACWPCHRDLSSSQAGKAWGAMRREMAARKYRPKEGHPGLRQASG